MEGWLERLVEGGDIGSWDAVLGRLGKGVLMCCLRHGS